MAVLAPFPRTWTWTWTCQTRGADEVSANRAAGVPITEPSVASHPAQERRPRDGLAMVTYWIEAGVVSTAAGAWAATPFSGLLRILVWGGVTAVLAAAAIWAAEPAIALLDRCYRAPWSRRRPSARLGSCPHDVSGRDGRTPRSRRWFRWLPSSLVGASQRAW